MHLIKGLHDIKTHGSLARQGKLIGVARNLHRLEDSESESGNVSDNWSVERHIYPKKKPAKPRRATTASLPQELFLENKVHLCQIEVIQDLIREINQAVAEGIPVVRGELERLTKRLCVLRRTE